MEGVSFIFASNCVENRCKWNTTNLPVDNSNFIKGLATICLGGGGSRISSGVLAEHQVVVPQIAVLQALEWSPRVKLILKYGLQVTEFRTEITESKQFNEMMDNYGFKMDSDIPSFCFLLNTLSHNNPCS